MKKTANVIITFLLVMVLAFGLTSCGYLPKRSDMTASDSDEQQAKKQEKIVLDTINTKNASAIKKLFSQKALSKIKNIDGKIDEFTKFYSGKFIKGDPDYSIEDDVRHGNDRKMVMLVYAITTDKDVYDLTCSDVVSNPGDPKDIGAFQLDIIQDKNAKSSVAWHNSREEDVELKCYYK